MPDPASLVPILAALVAGGAVTFYTARPRKNALIAEAADKAIGVVTKAIDRQEHELRRQATALASQEEELRKARDRIVALETQLRYAVDSAAQAYASTSRAHDERIAVLRAEVQRLGGDVDRINRIGKQGPPGDKGPPGDPGPPYGS